MHHGLLARSATQFVLVDKQDLHLQFTRTQLELMPTVDVSSRRHRNKVICPRNQWSISLRFTRAHYCSDPTGAISRSAREGHDGTGPSKMIPAFNVDIGEFRKSKRHLRSLPWFDCNV